MTSPLPPSESLHFGPPRARRRWHRTWPGIAAIAVAVALVGGGLAYVLWPGSPSPYALGKDFETAPAQADAGLVTGPVGQLTKACTADLGTAKPGQRPAATDKTAVGQWVLGCEAGYHQDHPGQLVQDGVMYGKGQRRAPGPARRRCTPPVRASRFPPARCLASTRKAPRTRSAPRAGART